jgi:hypothetical protein
VTLNPNPTHSTICCMRHCRGNQDGGTVASLLIQPVKGILELWRRKRRSSEDGWVFDNCFGGPVDLREVVRRVIVPTLKAKTIG